jgi:hypothetical protein
MALYYATRKRIKEYVESITEKFGFTKAEFIKEIDEAITNLSTDEETGLISKDYMESSKNQIHFYKKVKNYLVVSN